MYLPVGVQNTILLLIKHGWIEHDHGQTTLFFVYMIARVHIDTQGMLINKIDLFCIRDMSKELVIRL